MKKNMQKTISVFLSLLMLLSVFGVVAFAEGETTKEVSYIDAGGAPQTVEATVAVPGSHYTSTGTGWYVIEGTYSGNEALYFDDAVTNLILADDADWTIANSALISIGNVNSAGGTLNVYAQANNTGEVHLTNGLISYYGSVNVYGGRISSSQRIGGSPSNGDFTASNCTLNGSLYGKNITLYNCTVTGKTGNCTGDFTLEGGTYISVCESSEAPVRAKNIVIANAVVEGSGAQNGLQATDGSVTISNSTVNVTASNMAISGNGVSISGGNVTATGSGNFGIYSSGGPIEITGGTVAAEGGIFGLYGQSVILNGGNVTASGNVAGVNAGSTLTLGADVPDTGYSLGSVLSGATVTVKEGQTVTDGENDYTGTLTSDEVALLAGKTLTCKHVMADEWTCYDETRHVKVCTVCGGTPEYEDHDVIVRGAGDATCINAGYTGDEYCSVCGDRLSEGEIIQPTGNHTTVLVNAMEATATEDGYTGDEVCTVCGNTIKTGTVIPRTGTETPTVPDESSNDNICKWDNVDHGTSFLGKIIKLFHSILYLITHLFGQGEGTIC